jgi:hypothetical protein
MKRMIMCAAAGAFCISTASADETLKYRSIWHTTFIQSQNVPDTDGHIVAVTSASGVASFPDGSLAMDNFTGTLDYTKGSGTFMDYNDITFSDGSALFTKQLGTTTTEGQQSTFKGTITIHSITSSASASNVGATLIPSALAVLRLITSSNFVGS